VLPSFIPNLSSDSDVKVAEHRSQSGGGSSREAVDRPSDLLKLTLSQVKREWKQSDASALRLFCPVLAASAGYNTPHFGDRTFTLITDLCSNVELLSKQEVLMGRKMVKREKGHALPSRARLDSFPRSTLMYLNFILPDGTCS
jgi:hypothetical protein